MLNRKITCPKSKLLLVLFSFSCWFIAGFDLLQLTQLQDQTVTEFFPIIQDKTAPVLFYGILSLILLTRLLGALFFIKFFSRPTTLKITLILIPCMMALTAILPLFFNVQIASEHKIPLIIPIIFYFVLKIITAFLVGGIYPTVAVFALEKLSKINYILKEDKENLDTTKINLELKNIIKKNTNYSAIIQSGYNTGYFILALMVIYLLPALNLEPAHQISFISAIGVVIGGVILLIFYLTKLHKVVSSDPLKSKGKDRAQDHPQQSQIFQNFFRDNRSKKILQSLLLIFLGLMFMYYTSAQMIPMYSKYGNTGDLPKDSITIILIIASVLAHIISGYICYFIWKYEKSKRSLTTFAFRIYNFLTKKNIHTCNNLDLNFIIINSIIIIPVACLGFAFYNENTIKNEINSINMIVFNFIVVFLVNLSWGLMLSIITSSFDPQNRYIGASLSYNGGLLLPFLVPLLATNIYMNDPAFLQYVFSVMILGAIIMWFGAWRIKKIRN